MFKLRRASRSGRIVETTYFHRMNIARGAVGSAFPVIGTAAGVTAGAVAGGVDGMVICAEMKSAACDKCEVPR